MPAVSTLLGRVRNVACTSTPGVHTCCRVSLWMLRRKTLIGKNVRASAPETGTGKSIAQQSVLLLVVRA